MHLPSTSRSLFSLASYLTYCLCTRAGHYREHSYAGCYGQDSTDAGCDIVSRNEFRHTDDNTDNFTKWSDKHVVNAYGLLRSPWNMNAAKHVVRSGDMCGIKNDAQFPNCVAIMNQLVK